MNLEAPFFLREIRQVTRPSRTLRLYGTAAAGVILLFAFQLLKIGPDPEAPRAWPRETVYSAFVLHVLLCLMAGLYGGNRVFAAEHQQGTLEGLYLLPSSPGRWLLAKLAFPAYAVALTWAAGLPVYVLAVALNLGRMETALSLWMAPLLAGTGALGVILLLPPDYRDRLMRMQSVSGTRSPALDRDMLVRSLLLGGIFLGMMAAALARLVGRAGGSARLYVYGTSVPAWTVWTAAVLAVAAASFLTARSNLAADERPEKQAAAVRAAALAVLYALGLGVFWSVLPAWMRAGGILLPLAAFLLGRGRRRPREDRLSAGEARWLAARWDDALLVRDFRVYARYASLRRGLAVRGLAMAGWLVAQALLVTWLAERRLALPGHPLGWALGLLTLLPVAFLPPVQASQAWLKERNAKTLQMLLLTPLSVRAMLRSRLLAGALYYGTVFAPVLLLALGVVAAALARGYWVAGPAALGFLPVPLALVLALETAERPETSARGVSSLALLGMLLALAELACFCVCLWLATLAGMELSRGAAWTVGLTCFGVSLVTSWVCFQLRAAQLQALRSGQAEGGEG